MLLGALDEPGVVGGHEDRGPGACPLLQEPGHHLGELLVRPGGGLVQDDQPRAGHEQGAGQGHPHTLPAAEQARPGPGQVADPGPGQDVGGPLPALVAGQAQRPRGVAEGARHGPRVFQQEVLGLEDDRGAVRPADVALAHLTGGEAVKGDGSGEVEVVQAQAPRRGGLPAAVGAGERGDGASCQGQVEAVHEEAPAPGNGQARRGERVSHGGWSSCRGDCGWAALPGRRPLRARGRTLTG